jgi:hypothetical protein
MVTCTIFTYNAIVSLYATIENYFFNAKLVIKKRKYQITLNILNFLFQINESFVILHTIEQHCFSL